MVDNAVTIRAYIDGDEVGINDLFKSQFAKSRCLDEWKWKYRDNPAVEKLADWVTLAVKDGLIVGHYGSMPVLMRYKGETICAGQPVDTMLENLEETGIQTLKDLFKSHLLNAKIDTFGFGFPNEKAYPLGKRFLGYKNLGEMEHFFRRLSLKGALKRRFPNTPSWLLTAIYKISRVLFSNMTRDQRQYAAEDVDGFDKRIERLWEKVKDRFEITPVRTAEFLNWKYKDRGYKIILAKKGESISGYIVLKIREGDKAEVGYIIDLISEDESTIFLIHRGLEFFMNHNVDYALCGLICGDKMESYFIKAGFRRHDRFRALPVVYMPLSPLVDETYLKNPKNWYLTYGDIDGF
jgi:hypothetical protein